MTESKLCKSCQNIENCPCWSAKQTGRVISCYFHQAVVEQARCDNKTYQQQISVLRAELMDAIQAHEDDTGALRKELAVAREAVSRLTRQRKKWKDASAQLALEHNELIDLNHFLERKFAEARGRACPLEKQITYLSQELTRADNAALGFKEKAKSNKDAEIVALEMLGASRKKLKEAKTRLGVSRCITAAVVILAVVYHYFIRG